MQRLLDALKDQVLPRVQNGVSRVVPFLVHAENSGIEKFSEAYCYDTQRHGYFEFFWLLNGVATMKINGLLYTLAPGDFCFLPPLLQHADVYDASTPAYESLWFGC